MASASIRNPSTSESSSTDTLSASKTPTSASITQSSNADTKSASTIPVSTSTSMSVTTFTLFPKLPPELRVVIWHFALPRTRRIKVSGHPHETIGKGIRLGVKAQRISMLAVNHEAREVVLQHYDLTPRFLGSLLGRPVYIDYAKDLFHVASLYDVTNALWYQHATDVPALGARVESNHFQLNVRHLVLDSFQPSSWGIYAYIGRMKSLENLTIHLDLQSFRRNDETVIGDLRRVLKAHGVVVEPNITTH